MHSDAHRSDEQLTRQLASLDENLVPWTSVDSTIRDLHAELQTLVNDLHQPLEPDPHEQETAFQQAAERLLEIGIADQVVPELAEIGPYQLLAKLGHGGMGTVYKALHTRLHKEVALKVLPTERMNSPASVARFQREMKAVGQLDHPHIVRAMDAGNADGVHYLVMEYVAGSDLGELLKSNGLLPVADACELIRQAAIGLQAAHSRGMVHRDIKPANLMLATPEFGPPIVKVLDLGLALLSETQSTDDIGCTVDGHILGTIDYMAPEQAGDSHRVGIRSDVYSLGATLYALLSGGSIFQYRQFKTLMQKLSALANEPAPPIRDRRPEVPPELAIIVHRMLAHDPLQRFATPSDVADALAPFAVGADLPGLVNGAKARTGEESTLFQKVQDQSAPSTDGAEHPTAAARPLPRPVGGRFRRRRFVLATAALTGAAVLGAILLLLRTPHGEVVVTLGDNVPAEMAKQIKIEVRGNGEIKIADAAHGWTIDVKEGRYAAQLTGGNDRFELDEREVTVTRNQQSFVRVSLKPAVGMAAHLPGASTVGSASKPANEALSGMPALKTVNGQPASQRPDDNASESLLAERLRDQIKSASLPVAGEPMSPAALVTEPTPIDGARSWTLETPHHRGRIRVCRLSPDGTRLATGGDDATLRLWNVADRTLSAILIGHDCPLQSVEWSADGSVLLSAGGNEICLWDARRASLMQRLVSADTAEVRAGLTQAVWGPTSGELITASNDGKLRFWDLGTGSAFKTIETFAIWEGMQQPLAVDRESQRLVLCGQRNPVQVWETTSGEMLHAWEHSANFRATAISPDGRLVAAGGVIRNGRIHVWNAETGEGMFPDTPIEHHRDVDILAFSPDGTRLAATGWRDSAVHLWDMRTGRPLAAITTPHGGVTAACWSNDGGLLVTAGYGTETAIAFWDGATGRPRGKIAGGTLRSIAGLDWHPTEPRLAVGLRTTLNGQWISSHHGLSVWSLNGGMTRQEAFASNSPNQFFKWSPDGRWIVDFGLNLYDVSQGTARPLPIDDKRYHRFAQREQWAFSRDGSRLAIAVTRKADSRNFLQVRKMPGGELVGDWDERLNADALDLSPDGRQIAAVASDTDGKSKLFIVDAATGEVLRSQIIENHEQRGATYVRWSTDSQTIAVDDAWIVRTFDPETLEVSAVLPHQTGGAGRLTDLLWLDSHRLAGSRLGLIKIWDLEADAERLTQIRQATHSLSERPAPWTFFSPSPDGRYLAATGLAPLGETRVTIWDWAAERVAAMLILPAGEPPIPIFISPAGHYRWLGETDNSPELLAVIQTDEGQTWLPLDKFSDRYGWTNDPKLVPAFARSQANAQ